MNEILDEGFTVVDNSLRLTTHGGQGHRMVVRGVVTIASESNDDWARCAKIAVHIPRDGRRIALIGGGMCVLPRIAQVPMDIYELEPALARFVPPGCTFIPGDYRDTIQGPYDVLIFDLGEAPDILVLRRHCPTGLILGTGHNGAPLE